MTRFGYILRKYPLARFLCIVLVLLALFFVILFVGQKKSTPPIISSISPAVGSPGDVLIIKGDYFGNTRDASFVEISGSRLTESNYVSWQENEIKIIVPGNTQDGLLYVVSKTGRSNPDFFANESGLPRLIPQNAIQNIPIITSLSSEKVTPGTLLIISGKNFGETRESSHVYFSSHRDDALPTTHNQNEPIQDELYAGFIRPSDADFDYEYWSETEIRVRVPNGASSGSIYVVTSNGKSLSKPITIEMRVGQKSYPYHSTYLIQVSAELKNLKGQKNSPITLYLPQPEIKSVQPLARLIESDPETYYNYKNNSIFQLNANGIDSNVNKEIHQNFVVSSYAVETKINKESVRTAVDKQRLLYRAYTKPDECIPSNTTECKELLPQIIFQIKNPYRQAELVYEYLITNYKIQDKLNRNDREPLNIIKTKKGDAYEFAVLYTALLRTAGIPTRMISGILIDADKKSKAHWWSEFYIDNFGWIPVDTAVGAGLDFKPFQAKQSSSSFYFGNMDSQHIAFSSDWASVKQSIIGGKIVSYPKSYAMQSIWEEAAPAIMSYSSLWNVPIVLGIY